MSGLAPLFPEPIDEDCPPFPLRVLASTMRRSAETANFGGHQVHVVEQQSALNPLDKGDFVGMELEELQVENPSWYENLEQEPFHTRYVRRCRCAFSTSAENLTNKWFISSLSGSLVESATVT